MAIAVAFIDTNKEAVDFIYDCISGIGISMQVVATRQYFVDFGFHGSDSSFDAILGKWIAIFPRKDADRAFDLLENRLDLVGGQIL